MNVIDTNIEGVRIIEPKVFGDHRGWFYESFADRDYRAAGVDVTFVQDNQSFSKEKGTLRGIHFQNGEHAQAKLVRCTRGSVIDYAVDLRKGSPTYLKWESVELSAENKKQFFIPRGFGHAFLTLTDDVEFCYKADNYYNYEADRSIRYSDPDIAIEWPKDLELILSEKDETAPLLKDSDCSFVY
ncbi:MAG: dTDP-4-dehydrorhamnose 3,5-epimerase [Clostridiales Family XIII bacterium]|nr:dTDP-4-dehydrorhamnose 3,5-epimerase [Clostridiales Family XIII bacterium]